MQHAQITFSRMPFCEKSTSPAYIALSTIQATTWRKFDNSQEPCWPVKLMHIVVYNEISCTILRCVEAQWLVARGTLVSTSSADMYSRYVS